jgi:hypothetical protein
MKNYLLFILILFSIKCFGQNSHLKINGLSEKENKIVDSIGYTLNIKDKNQAINEINLFSEKAQKLGYLESKLIENNKQNDSTYTYTFLAGNKTNHTYIYINPKYKVFINQKSDTLKIAFTDSQVFLENISREIEKKGYSISKVRLRSISKKKNILITDLEIEVDKKRIINDIVINGYDKFPIGFKKRILSKYKNKVFNKESLEKINNDFSSIQFIKLTKYPEILFQTDSTKVYVFVEKKKNNFFDGFLGFSNSEKALILNGYLNLNLNNTLNSGDIFSLKWKSDGKEQKNFNLGIELPYVFRSPLGMKLQLNIFKQDSTFQNSKTDIDFGYYLNNRNKIFIGYQSNESSDIKNINSALLNDFKNNFITSSYEFLNTNNDFLFPEKTSVNLKIGFGKRESKFNTNQQLLGQLTINHIFEINNENSLFISSQNYFLKSDDYLTNELFRFGGIRSIRGFKENSLQGNIVNLLISEYRHKFTSNFYIHSAIDYGYFKDKTTNSTNKPFGFGFGFGLLNKSGILNLLYANGIDNKRIVKLSNSIIHISFKAFF